MKLKLLALLIFVASIHLASAGTIDVRFVRLSGHVPPPPVILHLVDEGAILTCSSFSIPVDAGSHFSYSNVRPLKYPTGYNSDGDVDASEYRSTGITFSGMAAISGTTVSLDSTFHWMDLRGTEIFQNPGGPPIAAPIFAFKDVHTRARLLANAWTVLPIADDRAHNDNTDNGPSHLVLLVRIRD